MKAMNWLRIAALLSGVLVGKSIGLLEETPVTGALDLMIGGALCVCILKLMLIENDRV